MCQKLKDWRDKVILDPLVGGAIALLTISVGVIVSLFSKELTDNLPPWLSWLSLLRNHPTAAWVIVSIGGFLVFCLLCAVQAAQNREASKARAVVTGQAKLLATEIANVKSQADNLAESVMRLESLPPEDFLTHYQEMHHAASRLTSATISKGTQAEVERAIRHALRCIATLAIRYDKRPNTVIYSADIMLRKKSGEFESKTPLSLPKSISSQYGLELIPSLSTTTNQQDGSQDPAAKSIVLEITDGVPSITDAGGKVHHLTLPSAPWTFKRKEYTQFLSKQELFDWLDKDSGMVVTVKQEVKEYFLTGHGKNIHSLAAMPIFALSIQDGAVPALGVLNLHSTENDLLKNCGGNRFAPLAEPFLYLLSILLTRRAGLLKMKNRR